MTKIMKSSNHGFVHTYDFDTILNDTVTQRDVYDEVRDVIFSAFDGFHVSVFAYGNTGSGKTHTIFGGDKPEDQGLIPRALKQIQEHIDGTPNTEFTISYGFSELYLDKLYNLMDEHKTIETQGFKLRKLKDTKNIVNSLLAHMKAAKKRRVTGRTEVNNYSSRSHAFFQFKIISKEDNQINIIEKMGSITFIDLAGSEKIVDSAVNFEKKQENIFINKSLTSLRDVLIALANQEPHIPYRNSKLTTLLQPYLGQEAKSLVIVNLCQNESYYYQTKSSMDFAKAIPRIKSTTGFRRNVIITPKYEWSISAFQGDDEDDDKVARVEDAAAIKRPDFSFSQPENIFK